MEFHYGKSISNRQKFIRGSRPQPSPSKTQQFLEELGLDCDDIHTDTSTSASEDEEIGSNFTEIEYRLLKKELASMTESCDRLKEENRELKHSLNRLNLLAKRDESWKKMRLKILHKAYIDCMKDRQALIVNLQEVCDEDGESANLSLVSTIQNLQEQKARLYEDLLQTQENYDNRLIELEDRVNDTNRPMQDPDTMQALEKVTEEKMKLSEEMDHLKKEHASQIEAYEKILKEKDADIIRANQERDKKSRSHNSIKLKLESLRTEMDSSKKERGEQEKQLENLVKQHKEEIEKLRKEKELTEKQMETLENNMTTRLSNEMELSQSSIKLQEENRKLMKEIDRFQMKTSDLETKAVLVNDLLAEKNQLKSLNKELQSELDKSLVEQEAHKTSWKEKLTFVEQERDEMHVQLQQQRRKANTDLAELKSLMDVNENQWKHDADEANAAYLALKKTSEESALRYEEMLTSANSKKKDLEEKIKEIKKELKSKSSEIATLQSQLEVSNSEAERMNALCDEREKSLEKERARADLLSRDLGRTKIEKESLERQLAVMSGESDSMIAQMEKESRDLRIQLSTAQECLLVMKRESEESSFKNKESVEKIIELKSLLDANSNQNKAEVEKILESHKREIVKLKASAAIASDTAKSRSSTLESALRLAMSSLQQMSRDKVLLRREIEKFPGLLKSSIKQAAKQVSDAVADINETNKDLVRRYRKEMTLRKKYHNELVELRGNIRVFVRARPIIAEDGKNKKIALSYDDSDDAILYVNNSQKGRSQTFEVDRVFRGHSTQEEVYNEVQALVTSCMDGYHVCIFAYGQTGSGKTYTMEGTTENPGINQRALNDLFHLIDDRSADWEYTVKVSLLEIYNETLRDLLSSKSEKLDIKMNTDGSLFVHRLKKVGVKDLDDVNKLFRTGHSNRATASTNMNERSSRSHAVLMISVDGKNLTTGTTTAGRLNLIDLAGSERVSKSGASGDRLKEAQNINKSLSSLGDVIHALRNKQGHVPFRNSKLTYLLQDSLSNESKTLMMVQVSPIENSLGETVCSLNFAQRVRAVELGQATKKLKAAS